MQPTKDCELLAGGLKASNGILTSSDGEFGSVAPESTGEVAREEQHNQLDEAERAAAYATRIALRRRSTSASASDGRAVAQLTFEALVSGARQCTRYVQQSWPRILGAVLSLCAGGWPGWMLVTRSWVLFEYAVAAPPAHQGGPIMPWETPWAGSYSLVGPALATCLMPVLLIAAAESQGLLRSIGVAAAACGLYALYRIDALGPFLGGCLILAGVVGALSALLHRSDAADAQASSPNETALVSAKQATGLLASLDGLISAAPDVLPEAAHALLVRIRECVEELEPRLAGDAFPSDDRNTVELAVTSWLPDTLASYGALPRRFREQEILQNGRTALSTAVEQLERIDEKLGEVRARANHAQAVPLLVQDLFLERRLPRLDDRFLNARSVVQGMPAGRASSSEEGV